jgi:hypothetical protein
MDTLTQLTATVLQENNSEDIGKILGTLPVDNGDAVSRFCDIYKLGDGVYDLYILHGVDMRETLANIGMQKMLEETEDMSERRERMYELQNQA